MAAKITELGFTVSTLVKDEELDNMMNSLTQIFRWDLLIGERYGIKAACKAERRHVEDDNIKRLEKVSDPAVKSSNFTARSNVSPYAPPMITMDNDDGISYIGLVT
ncbi:hypothetical protein JHK85_006705 [Glycine max]|nr:hypothetical protein JHK85_006705 [Glycine max]